MRRITDFDNLIKSSETILDALRLLDICSIKVLFVVDKDDKIAASVSDGDIRRAILKGVSLKTPIIDIANADFHHINSDDINQADFIWKETYIPVIPYINSCGMIGCIYVSDNYNIAEYKETISVPVIIMAGGRGTRLYPYTKILPKPLIPIEDTPICERIIQSFVDIGCSQFHLIVNYKKNMIKSYFSDAGIDANISFVDEDIPLGTGGGLRLLKDIINGTFILTNCDIIILENVCEIVRYHKENSNDVTMVCSLKNFEIPYGVVNISEGGELASFEEKPKMSFFTNTGYYILEDCVMEYIDDNETIGMPDIIERMKADGRKIGVYPISENSWLDMGQFDSMEGMERRLRELSK